MADSIKKIGDLIVKYLGNDQGLDEDEQNELLDWMNQSEENRKAFEELTDPVQIRDELRKLEALKRASWTKIKAAMDAYNVEHIPIRVKTKTKPLVWSRLAIAATALLILTGVLYFMLRDKQAFPSQQATTEPGIVTPGQYRAILTLADHSTITLDASRSGHIARQGPVEIFKEGDTAINYRQSTNEKPDTTKKSWNTLTTPRGGHYMLTLPDGSKVWLNADASITYPVSFTGPVRKVTLRGEAYFEVTDQEGPNGSPAPFLVETNGTLVEVLGTRFNIMAYDDEPVIRTTLLEGSVKVSPEAELPERRDKPQPSFILKPGQQAQFYLSQSNGPTGSRFRQVLVQTVDPTEVIAWKNGSFHFVNAEMAPIMRQIARWYDVQIEYRNDIPQGKFTVLATRDNNLPLLLESLKKTSRNTIDYTIEGRKITIINLEK